MMKKGIVFKMGEDGIGGEGQFKIGYKMTQGGYYFIEVTDKDGRTIYITGNEIGIDDGEIDDVFDKSERKEAIKYLKGEYID